MLSLSYPVSSRLLWSCPVGRCEGSFTVLKSRRTFTAIITHLQKQFLTVHRKYRGILTTVFFSQIFHCFVHAYRLKPDVVRLIEQEGSNSKQKRHIDVSVSNESPRLPCRVQLRSAKGNFWMKNNRAVITMHKQLINILTVVLRWRVASKPVIGWRMPPSNSTQITDGCGVGYRDIWQLLCFVCMQTVTADTVIAYITHDYLPKMSSASSRNWVKLRGSLYLLNSLVQLTYMNWPSACLISNHPYLAQFHTTRIIAFISKSTTYLPNYTSALALSRFPSGFLRTLFV